MVLTKTERKRDLSPCPESNYFTTLFYSAAGVLYCKFSVNSEAMHQWYTLQAKGPVLSVFMVWLDTLSLPLVGSGYKSAAHDWRVFFGRWEIIVICNYTLNIDEKTSQSHNCDVVPVLLFVGCLTSPKHTGVSQGWICSDNFTCCHTEIEVADPTIYFTQSQYTDAGLTSPSADPITPGAQQGSHWSASFEVTGMTRPRKILSQVEFKPRIFRSPGGCLNL